MKKIVKYVDVENGIFACMDKKNLVYYYLTKSNIKKYMDYIEEGNLISFIPTLKTKRIDRRKCYNVESIYKIERIGPREPEVLYSLAKIRNEIYNVITKFDYYLFVDFEMSMPPFYRVKSFQAEIIQYGFVLTDKNLNIIETYSSYIKPTLYDNISTRTYKFLKISKETFDEAKPYDYFYKELKVLMKKYNPKIVAWGRNDYLTLKQSYPINSVKALTNHNNFINLLQIIKTYYNLYNDLGLARGFKRFVKRDYEQKHNALHDAYILKEIFEAFKKEMEIYNKRTFKPLKV